MKNLKIIVIFFIVFALLIVIAPIFMEAKKVIALGMFLFILPFVALEFLIPSNLLNHYKTKEKISWYSHLMNYLVAFPLINLWLIIALNGMFGFLPQMSMDCCNKDVLQMDIKTISFILKLDALIYLAIISVALFIRKIFPAYQEKDEE